MGSTSSCLSAVAPLNVSSGADDEPDQSLLEKLSGQPALLSKPVPGFSLLLGGAGQTWVHVACERRQVQVVQRLFEFLDGSNLVVVREALGPYCRRTGLPLPVSPAEGLRIAAGMCNGKGQTPLMLACYAGCPVLVKYLLEKGANPWAYDRCGCRTALHYAAISGCVGCVAALMRTALDRQPPLRENSSRYIDARTLSGMTALHYAVLFERHAVLVELLRHAPDINAATLDNSSGGGPGGGDAPWLDYDAAATPLHFAAARGDAVCALELLRHFAARQPSGSLADPRSIRNAVGQQPWQLAVVQHPELRYLAAVLRPAAPLPLRMNGPGGFGGQEEGGQAALGPPSLATIAAAALRDKLLAAVTAAEAFAAATAMPGINADYGSLAAAARPAGGTRSGGGDKLLDADATSFLSARARCVRRSLCEEGLGCTISRSFSANCISMVRHPRGSGGATAAVPDGSLAIIGPCTDSPTTGLSQQHKFHHLDCRRHPLSQIHPNRGSGSGSNGVLARGLPDSTSRVGRRSTSQERHPFGVHVPAITDSRDAAAATDTAAAAQLRDCLCSGDSCSCSLPSLRQRRVDSLTDPLPVSSCLRPDAAAANPRIAPFRRRAFSAAAAARSAVSWAAAGAGDGGGGWALFSSPVEPKTVFAAAATTAAAQPRNELADVRAGDGNCDAEDGSGGGDGGGGNSCGVCYARPEAVSPVGCRHGLCGDCARELSHAVRSRPLLCPFCRRPVSDFARLPAATTEGRQRGARRHWGKAGNCGGPREPVRLRSGGAMRIERGR